MSARRAGPGRLSRQWRSLYAQVLRARQNRVVILTEPAAASPYPPVFLVGCPRSGTSLVRRIVDSHSRIACPPESHFLAALLPVLTDRRSMAGLESMGFGRTAVIERFRRLSEQFFLDYAAASSKARWADKTPVYVDHLDGLDELFDRSARYVLIYRHGLDVSNSIAEVLPGLLEGRPGAGVGKAGDIRAAAAYWCDKVTRMLAFERQHSDRCLHLRYEALTTAPEIEVRRLFAFLGEEFEAATLDFNARPHDEGLEDGKVRSTRGFEPVIGSYRRWHPDVLEAARAEADPGLAALGYDVEP